MKSMRPPSAAIFFMTYFYRAGGGPWPPWPPPGSATVFIGYTAIAKDSGSAGFLREGNYNPIPKLHVKFDI